MGEVMDELFKKILEIEQKAQDIVYEAKVMKENFVTDLENEMQRHDDETQSRARERIEKLRAYEQEMADTETARIEDETRRGIENMMSIYDKNRQIWEDEMFAAIIVN